MKVSLIIPTRNESENISPLLKAISANLGDCQYEVLVVDDSDDNRTAFLALANGARVIKGQGKGLGQAIIDGIKEVNGDVVLVMDADFSHSPKDLQRLLKPIVENGVDLVIGSRYVKGGDVSSWTWSRRMKSQIGVYMMYPFVGVKDANSGYFAFRKEIIRGAVLNPATWKIMLEVLFKGNWISKLEVPITFGNRYTGESKRSGKQVRKDALNIARLIIYKYRHFINFAIVGGIGSIWYYALLYTLTEYAGLWYITSAIIGTLVAIMSNYLMNHYWTFRHKKSTNRNMLLGWLKYAGNSAIGDGLDLGVLALLTDGLGLWYMLSAFLASGVAAVVKYIIANKLIWKEKKRKASDADYEWHSYYKGLLWQKRWKQKLAGIVKEMAGKADSTLDIGCGSSPCGVLINHDDYIGIDPNKAKIDYMDGKRLKDCMFIHGDLDTVTFTENGYFDTILFIEVIEHLVDIGEARFALEKIHRLLKDSGQAIIATPNFGSWTGRMQDRLYGMFQKGAYKDEHTLKFNLPSLIKLCGECGLEYDKSVIPFGADMVCRFTKALSAK